MGENRLKVFTDEEIWVIYNAFYECNEIPSGSYDTFNRLHEEFGIEQDLREDMRRERIINND